MTEKLYYQDAYLTEFTATVLECRPIKEEFAVILDRSAFYPEGGGQPGDTGSLNGIPVTDTQEREGLICHYTASTICSSIPVSTSSAASSAAASAATTWASIWAATW